MLPKIYGFNKSSEAGPDKFAASIFLNSCNLRCDYCMNSKLVLEPCNLDPIPIEVVEDFAKDTECEWIDISGGEITVHSLESLMQLFEKIKTWNCKIAISTNGILSDKLAQIIPYVNYVSLDIKTGFSKYDEIVCDPIPDHGFFNYAFYNVMDSLFLLMTYKKMVYDFSEDSDNVFFDYEVRTTLYPPLVTKNEIHEIGSILRRKDKWILQPFRRAMAMLNDKAYQVKPYTNNEIDEMLQIAKEYVDNSSLGYV